jgi:hypothetical protein
MRATPNRQLGAAWVDIDASDPTEKDNEKT